MAALTGETWVSSADTTCNRLLTHGAGRAGFTPRVAFASDDYGAVGRLVLAGVGVALVPELAAAAVGTTWSCAGSTRPRPARSASPSRPSARPRRTRCSRCSSARVPRLRRPCPPRSSRPTTSAASTASRSTATSPSRSAARSRACSPTCAARRRRELRIGLGRDMRLTAPELAARYRDGHGRRGRARARRRDGRDRDALLPRRLARARRRADVHRLAQPEGLHGRQARARGRARAVGRRRDRRHPRARRRGAARAPDGPPGSVEDVDVYAGVPARGARRSSTRPRSGRSRSCSTAATAWPARWSGRSSSGSARSSWSRRTGRRTARSPTTSRTRCCPRTARFVIDKVRSEGADLGIAWDGDADRCFFIDGDGAFVDGDFLTALLARSVLEAHPGADILYDVRASRAVADTVRGGRRHPARQPRRPRVLQGAHARGGRRVRRRGLRPLLLRRLLRRGLGHAARAADPRAARPERPDARRAARAVPLALLHLGRDQLGGRGPRRADRGDPRAPRRRRDHRARRPLGRLRRLALQRARVEHRAAAAPLPGEPGLRRRTWRPSATRCSP